ncbi:MAG: arylsulfatase [Microbacterium sp.]|nr:arylsulfatase [Microbacterium sp.]
MLVILLDDVGFGQIGCFGGLGGRVRTPNLDRLAAEGLRYNNFHVAPMCSPTRASLLTGRNHHTVGVGLIMEILSGYPGYNGMIPKETAMIPAVLSEQGYCAWAVGKWHLVPTREVNPLGPMDRWPLRQGFDRYYGFLSAQTDQYRPSLWEDNRHIGYPEPTDKPYHFTEDIVDRSIEWIAQQQAIDPNRPFFHYFSPGAMHQPHQVPQEWVEPYVGLFSDGWDAVREQTFVRQQELGVVPSDAELPERNPGVREWTSLSDDERRLVERQMEVYAGFLAHTDHQIGRLLQALDDHGIAENTLIMAMSDNGASGEGSQLGMRHQINSFNGEIETFDEKLAAIDEWNLGSTCSNYAVGWAMAGGTPNRWYKRMTHEGGTRSPLIVRWPARIRDAGAVRPQFHHVTDVMPTILESAGIAMGDRVRGYEQVPLEGTSFGYTFTDGAAPTTKKVQYFEMLGHRAIWSDGWKAVAPHMSAEAQRLFCGGVIEEPRDGVFPEEDWELYHLDEDFAEARDVAALHPDRLAGLVEMWWEEANKFQVLPLDDRYHGRYVENRLTSVGDRSEYVYHGPIQLTTNGSPNVKGTSHRIEADITVGADGYGAIVSDGGPTGGFVLGIERSRVLYASNYLARTVDVLRTELPLTPGRHRVVVDFVALQDLDNPRAGAGVVTLRIDAGESMTMQVNRTNPVRYDLTGEGLRVGADINGVSDLLSPPARFTGQIHSVRITKNPVSPDTGAVERAGHLALQ